MVSSLATHRLGSSAATKWGKCRIRLLALCGELTLTNMHDIAIMMHMRTTLILNDELLGRARRLSGLAEKTAVVHAGLEALIARESARRLAILGGSEPRLKAAPRRRARAGR